jgi:hypothetical protein
LVAIRQLKEKGVEVIFGNDYRQPLSIAQTTHLRTRKEKKANGESKSMNLGGKLAISRPHLSEKRELPPQPKPKTTV